MKTLIQIFFLSLILLSISSISSHANTYALGSTNLLLGPLAGTNSVILLVSPSSGTWTATTNSNWLHLSPANRGGTGSANVIFSYDANLGATRSSTLNISSQTVIITQAGSNYIAAGLNTLVSGLNAPSGVVVDGYGSLYISDTGNSAIKFWSVGGSTLTTLVASGLSAPRGLALDGSGNLWVADSGLNAIMKFFAVDGYGVSYTFTGYWYSSPQGVALDGTGDLFVANTGSNSIWLIFNYGYSPFISTGLSYPYGVATDIAGNVYIADTFNNAIKKWTAANGKINTLVSSGLAFPPGLAVDGSGNVYIADLGNKAIKKWTAANSNVITLVSSGLAFPRGMAVDNAGNVYIADSDNNAIEELPCAFVIPTAKSENAAAGNDALPAVLPVTANLDGPCIPTSDQVWLVIGGITNGVVNFSFTANTGSTRTAHIVLLGQTNSITQVGLSLGTTALLEGPWAGVDSVVLALSQITGTWTATTNANWLHLSPASQGGIGSANVIFSYDANPGAPRYGSITISGQTVAITQAGSNYVAAAMTTVVSGLNVPSGVAVDGVGNLDIADTGNSAIKQWSVVNNTLTTLVVSGLSSPRCVAVDSSYNVYFADTGNSAIKKWNAGDSNITTLVSSGLNVPSGLAVDGSGNVYIADTGSSAIKKWTAANSNMTTLVSSGLNSPQRLALDGSGSVYVPDYGNNTAKKWTAANTTMTNLAFLALNGPEGMAVDGARNVYLADTFNSVIKELPDAFVDPTSKQENPANGSDNLPAVLPITVNLTGPFAPTSDKSWLLISGITNGVVSFSFAINYSASRTAHIVLLGQTVSVTQGAGVPPTIVVGPSIFPSGTIGQDYNQTNTAHSGTPPYSFIVSNGSLPPGLSLSIGGVLSGKPTVWGTFTFTVQATDSSGYAGSGICSITIGCPSMPLSPALLPDGKAGVAYNQTIAASGGSAPYIFSGKALPMGLNITSSGVISGTPIVCGTFPIIVTFIDAIGCTGTGNYNLNIASSDVCQQWLQTTPLPDGYISHTLSYASGYLYNIGGSSDTEGDPDGTNVFYAQVHSDGTIGAWTNATPLPVAVLNHAGVAANGFMFVLGGYHYTDANGDVPSDVVYYSKVNTNGTLGSWQTANPLPNTLSYLSASVWNNTIYVIGGIDVNSQPQNSVYSAQIQTDGSLSPWVAQPPLPVPNDTHYGSGIFAHASVANGFLYMLGGLIDGGTQISANVYYTKINADGTLAGWNQTTPMPQGLCFFGAVTAGGRVFVIGGSNGSSTVNPFYNATVMGDGSLSSWLIGTPLPQQLEGLAAAVSDAYIFVSGGLSATAVTPAVYSMALPSPPAAPTFVSRSFTNGNFQLQLASTNNTGFGLLASTNLTDWTRIAAGFTDTNGSLLFQDTNAASFPNRFYRAYWPLP